MELKWLIIMLTMVVLRTYLNLSPLVMIVLLILMCAFSWKAPMSAEQAAPVHETGTASGLTWGVSAIQGRRPYMEDAYQVAQFAGDRTAARVGLTHWFAVYDGHGGKRAAAWAHKHLLAKVVQTIGSKSAGAQLHDEESRRALLDAACTEAFLATDGEFVRHARVHAIPDGSTAICCMMQTISGGGRRLLVANVGDSRCAMVRSDGSGQALSFDHKPNRPDERARVEACGGAVVFAGCWRVQGDLAVSRAFGDCHLKPFGVSAEPELTTFDVEDNAAFLVLASDGLWDVVDESQCAKAVLRSRDTQQAARTLCDLATTLGSMDNITALVVDLRDARLPGS